MDASALGADASDDDRDQRRWVRLTAVGDNGQTIRESRNILSIEPQFQEFETVAHGTATGWAPEHDQAVRELFQEGQVLWFDSPEAFAAFAARLKDLVGVTIPAVESNGKTILAVLGQPESGLRPFEVVSVQKPIGPPDTFLSRRILVDLLYSQRPTAKGTPTVFYHILTTDLSALKPPLEVHLLLSDAVQGGEIAFHTLLLKRP